MRKKLIKDNQTFHCPPMPSGNIRQRGGVKSKHYRYSGSNDVNEVAWNYINADGKVHPVATKKPNELGIYDMSGNVSEWCFDSYRKYGKEESINPRFFTIMFQGLEILWCCVGEMWTRIFHI